MYSVRLKQIRTQFGYTQARAAELVGITTPSYAAYESGKSAPSIDALKKYAAHYGVSIDWLCGIDTGAYIIKNRGDFARSLYALLRTGEFEILQHKIPANPSDPDSGEVFEFAELKTYVSPGAVPEPTWLDNFLVKYHKMSLLLWEGTVSQEIFDTWLESEFDKLDRLSL